MFRVSVRTSNRLSTIIHNNHHPPNSADFRRSRHRRRDHTGRSHTGAHADQPGRQHVPFVRQSRPGVHLLEDHQHTVLVRLQVRCAHQQSRLPRGHRRLTVGLLNAARQLSAARLRWRTGAHQHLADFARLRHEQRPAGVAGRRSVAADARRRSQRRSAGRRVLGSAGRVAHHLQQRPGPELRVVVCGPMAWRLMFDGC